MYEIVKKDRKKNPESVKHNEKDILNWMSPIIIWMMNDLNVKWSSEWTEKILIQTEKQTYENSYFPKYDDLVSF